MPAITHGLNSMLAPCAAVAATTATRADTARMVEQGERQSTDLQRCEEFEANLQFVRLDIDTNVRWRH